MGGQSNDKRNRGRGSDPKDGFDQAIIDIARVTRVMRGGKRMRFRACVLIGDHHGKVGVGLAKGQDVAAAVNKAATKARKKIISVAIHNQSIPHQVAAKFKAAKIILKPAPKGSGVIAGGAARTVLYLAGVENVVGKILGSNSKINNVQATLLALQKLKRVPEKAKEKSVEPKGN